MNQDQLLRQVIKPLLFCLAITPLILLLLDLYQHQLGANPIETISHRSGDWTLRFLLLTLAITPLRRLSGWNIIIRLRRMLGLFTFFYGVLHFLTYVLLDQYLDLQAIVEDIIERPYISIGFLSFALLIPLAATSTNAMIRRLGGKNWRRLHRLAYVAAVGGVLHYAWLVKADNFDPLVYGAILAVLLGYRLWWATKPTPSTRPNVRPGGERTVVLMPVTAGLCSTPSPNGGQPHAADRTGPTDR